MKNPGEKLMAELAEERKELRVNVALTLITLMGLLFSIFADSRGYSELFVYGGLVVSFLAGGIPTAKTAFGNLLKGHLDIDLLMILAAIAATLVGAMQDGAILLFLFSLAGTLEDYAMGSTKRAVVGLMKLRPDTANVQGSDGVVTVVPVESLTIGQTILVRPGERVPIDGVVKSGSSAIDQSSITGESVPVEKEAQDKVFAGSVNGQGALIVTVTALASHSTIAQMIKLVTEAQAKRSPSESFSDWFGERYTIVVLVGSVLALIGFIVWGIPYEEAFYKAATLLVVASPCAIVISVPAAILSALAASAKRGMLFKGGAALETFARVDIVAFDKTGTLTEAKMEVKQMMVVSGTEDELLSIAAALEAESEHPLATSIIEYAKQRNVRSLVVSNTKAVPGKGITATIGGQSYWAGNRKMIALNIPNLKPADVMIIESLEARGLTTIVVGSGEEIIGVFGIADTVRDSALTTISALRASGIKRIVMLTGDHKSVAEAVGKTLGILPDDIYSDLLPTDKVSIVTQLRKDGIVAFVGDGVNDAAALATSDVGIAIGSAGSDVALEAADVALLSDDLVTLVRAQALAQKTSRIIKQNLIFAIGVLVAMVIVTVFFYLPISLGVIGHEGGALLVVLNGLRLLWLK